RYNTGAFGSWTQGRYSAQGGVFRRVAKEDSTTENRRERIDPATGAIARSNQQTTKTERSESTGMNGQVTYNLGDKDVLAGVVLARVGMTALNGWGTLLVLVMDSPDVKTPE
ncbi:hypothetical protein DVK02_19290, partial [Halobellus sp. Atlit-31R]